MITKYKVNKEELIININFLYKVKENNSFVKNMYQYTNYILQSEKIHFLGKKIIIYIDGILIGTFYLTNFYLKKLKHFLKNIEINERNSYFVPSMVLEINPNGKKVKTQKVLTY